MLPEAAAFLAAATAARKNIMIAGATNAGKTTLLRAVANQIPPGERLITVERALEQEVLLDFGHLAGKSNYSESSAQ